MDYRAPRNTTWGGVGLNRLESWLANAAFLRNMRRAVFARLPFPPLVSDVRDVLYASWMVPVDAVAGLVPPGVVLRQWGGMTVVTVLTYAHGHFGPRWLGPLRRLCLSPMQSNWRLYVDAARSTPQLPERTVLFTRNVFDSWLYALGTRVFSDALPSHRAGRLAVVADAQGIAVRIDSGGGSAPDLYLRADYGPAALPDAFAVMGDWAATVAYLTCQDAAVAQVADLPALARSDISLPVNLADVRPMRGVVADVPDWLRAMGAVGMPLCFAVPRVTFTALSDAIVARW
ncbi:hypothetical protein GTZ99_06840 [Novosphingobium sp. FSY-8]|uniref:Uncharacterized protein n=1 Tax=Novosphingobium ovatum TaxID=1908523 RepID=A0ABW9XCN0_9SPHN|nr:DUF2071 domain-containing protein [Novosphingobium ovatum]NBC36273.1 hypothetical protein [Novosphingobium ovatum]